MSVQDPINGEVAAKMREIDAMTPHQQEVLAEALQAKIEANRAREREQAQADFDSRVAELSRLHERIGALTPAQPDDEPEQDDVKSMRSAWIDLEDLRRDKPAEELEIDGVMFSRDALPYLPEGLFVAGQLAYDGLLEIVGRTPDGNPADESQNLFAAARIIAETLNKFVHGEVLY